MNLNKCIPAIVFGIVFIIFVVFFNYLFVGRNSRAVSETSEATIPVLSVMVGNNEINSMHGYTNAIDKDLLRDSIVPLETSYDFSVALHNAKEKFNSVSYKVYETNNEKVRETGIASFQEKKAGTMAKVSLKKKLNTGTVYLMELDLENEKGVTIHYYTRLKYGTELHFSECMDFINEFHKAAIKGGTEGNEYVAQFLEPKETSMNNNLSKVDINSNNSIVCYSGLKPVVEKSMPAKVTEITEDLSSVEKQMIISHEKENGKKEYYLVTEYYKIRYSVSRMYLLDYERTQEEYFQYDAVDGGKNRFMIGITSSDDKDLHTESDCEKAAFVQNNQLWYYDFQAGEMIKAFSFIGEDYRDIQNNYNGHGIDILKMKKNGDLVFIVYGYMNRGSHEGENGICVYRFDYKDRVNEEVMFIPTKIPYENMKTDISQLAYLNDKDVFSFYLDGSVYKVDADKSDHETVATRISQRGIVSSRRGKVAFENKNGIQIVNLETGKEQKIPGSNDSKAIAIGFIDNDFAYGMAEQSKIRKRSDGSLITPMTEVRIVDGNLNEVKSYRKDGIYIMDASTEDTLVKMSRAKYTGGKYEKLADEYIHYKEDSKTKVSFEYSYNTDLLNQLYMVFPTFVYVTTEPKLVNAKESATDHYKMIEYETNQQRGKICYVYAKGDLKGSYTSVKEAIRAAKQGAGVVVNSKQNYIWEKGVAKEYAKVANVGIVKAKNKSESFAACMQMVLKLDANPVSYDTLIQEKGSEEQILEKYFGDRAVNLSGCSLDDIVYYITKGKPFIARRTNGSYVVVMSYNSTKIRYIDPVKGESIAAERQTMKKDFEKAGSRFYSYTD